jgi:hypothetical protein
MEQVSLLVTLFRVAELGRISNITFRSFSEYSWKEKEIMKERKDYTFLYILIARSMKFKSEYSCFQSPLRLYEEHMNNITLYDTEQTDNGAEIV